MKRKFVKEKIIREKSKWKNTHLHKNITLLESKKPREIKKKYEQEIINKMWRMKEEKTNAITWGGETLVKRI